MMDLRNQLNTLLATRVHTELLAIRVHTEMCAHDSRATGRGLGAYYNKCTRAPAEETILQKCFDSGDER